MQHQTKKDPQTKGSKGPQTLNFTELVDARSRLSTDLSTLNNISKMMKDLVAIDNDHLEAKVEEIIRRYHEVCDLKHKYVIRLQDEVEKKEVAKQQHFRSSKLNIKLQKFKGYESSLYFQK